jgi:hypothetical protein
MEPDALDTPSPALAAYAWLTQDLPGSVEPTLANLRSARAFLQHKWRSRAAELGRSKPQDLAGACKFAALFTQRVFGGRLQSNYDHDYVVRDGQTLDLTNAEGVTRPGPYTHDRLHHAHIEHLESLELNLPRVDAWVQEFLHARCCL